MPYPWITPLAAALSLLLLAVVAWKNAPRGELSQVFVFFVVLLCFWNLNFFVLYSVKSHEMAWFLSRILRTGTLFLPPAILHLFVSIDSRTSSSWRKLLAVDYGAGAVLAFLNSFDVLVIGLRRSEWGWVSVGSGWYDVFTVFALLNAGAALSVLIFDYRTSTHPRSKQQLAFWIAGSTFATPLVLTNLLPAYGVPIYPPGNLGSAVWAGVIGYAIIRHRLMDIELAVSKGLSFLVVLVVFLFPFGVGVVALQRYTFGSIDYNASVGFVGLCIVGSLTFSYAWGWVDRRFEASLLRGKREARETLVTFGKGVVRMLDEPRIVEELANCASEAFRLKNVALFASGESARRFELSTWRGDRPIRSVIDDPELVSWLGTLAGPVLYSEVESMEGNRSFRRQAVAMFDQHDWEVVVPLSAGGQALGILGLGTKPLAEAYSQGDLAVLETLGAQASVAVENARLHERLKRSQQILSRSDRLSALGTLAAGIAHEIRNPLVSIQTFFQLAPLRLDDEEFMSSFLSLAEKEVSRIRSLIGELLSYAKASEPKLEETMFYEIVDRAVGLLAPHANERRVNLEVADLSELPPVQADGDQLLQAVINVVLNAIDATGPNGYVQVSGARSKNEDGEFSMVEVEDSGSGIPQEMIEAIFDPFFTTKDEGTGLGLAISHRIVSDLGGFVSVTSSENVGSRFVIALPVSGGGSVANLSGRGMVAEVGGG